MILMQARYRLRVDYGPNGVPGVAYKRAAKWLIDVFQEALFDLCHGGVVDDGFLSALWIPIGKVVNPTHLTHIRDLELPNEDRKLFPEWSQCC